MAKAYGWPEMNNLIDLSYLAQAVYPKAWNRPKFGSGPSLQALTLHLLNKDLEKATQLSGWSAEDLSPIQIKCRCPILLYLVGSYQ